LYTSKQESISKPGEKAKPADSSCGIQQACCVPQYTPTNTPTKIGENSIFLAINRFFLEKHYGKQAFFAPFTPLYFMSTFSNPVTSTTSGL